MRKSHKGRRVSPNTPESGPNPQFVRDLADMMGIDKPLLLPNDNTLILKLLQLKEHLETSGAPKARPVKSDAISVATIFERFITKSSESQ